MQQFFSHLFGLCQKYIILPFCSRVVFVRDALPPVLSNLKRTVQFFVVHLSVAVLCVPALIVLAWGTKNIIFQLFLGASTFFFGLVLPVAACALAVCVVTLANPMHALLSLVGVFLSTVLFYVNAGIEFIGLVFLIVYVGAVAILFLFVIMLLNVKSLTSRDPLIKHSTQVYALVSGGLLAYHLFSNIADRLGRTTLSAVNYRTHTESVETSIDDAIYYEVMYRSADVNAIAPLYTEHVALFWIITINLLLALLGGIILATSTTEQPVHMIPHTRNKAHSITKFSAAKAKFYEKSIKNAGP